jgi:hypothetical protein
MEKFEIYFDQDWFPKRAVIDTQAGKVIVVDTPKPHYKKWYWRVLNILTFKRFFNERYTYTVRML